MPDQETLSRDLVEELTYAPLPDLAVLVRERAEELETRAATRLREIRSTPLGPRAWPERGDEVIPTPAALHRVLWKGAIYTVALCRHEGFMYGGACASCRAPIEPGDLYVPRNGSLPLCIDCVESAPHPL